MYIKRFEIRWRDLDANKHLGNSSYVDFMSHTRMSFFMEQGIDLTDMDAHGLGPIVFHEHIYYFKEIRLGAPVDVSLEMAGMSEDARFVKFAHRFYDLDGKNLAYAEMLFSWIDLETRRLAKLPEELEKLIRSFPKSADFKILSKDDLRSDGKRPVDKAL